MIWPPELIASWLLSFHTRTTSRYSDCNFWYCNRTLGHSSNHVKVYTLAFYLQRTKPGLLLAPHCSNAVQILGHNQIYQWTEYIDDVGISDCSLVQYTWIVAYLLHSNRDAHCIVSIYVTCSVKVNDKAARLVIANPATQSLQFAGRIIIIIIHLESTSPAADYTTSIVGSRWSMSAHFLTSVLPCHQQPAYFQADGQPVLKACGHFCYKVSHLIKRWMAKGVSVFPCQLAFFVCLIVYGGA